MVLYFKVKEKIANLAIATRKNLTIALSVTFILCLLLIGYLVLSINQNAVLNKTIEKIQSELTALKNEDQYKINQDLKNKIKKSEDTYNKSLLAYNNLIDLRIQGEDTSDLDELFAAVLADISKLDYASAGAKLADLNSQIGKAQAATAATTAPAGKTTTAAVNNTPPGSGYSYQAVKTDQGTFNVAIIAADLNSTRVIIDTASEGDCGNNCPVMALGAYAARSGAFAAINGSFSVLRNILPAQEKQILLIHFL